MKKILPVFALFLVLLTFPGLALGDAMLFERDMTTENDENSWYIEAVTDGEAAYVFGGSSGASGYTVWRPGDPVPVNPLEHPFQTMDLGYGYLQLLSGDGCLWGWNQRDEEPLNLYRIDTSHEDALSAEPVASLDWASEIDQQTLFPETVAVSGNYLLLNYYQDDPYSDDAHYPLLVCDLEEEECRNLDILDGGIQISAVAFTPYRENQFLVACPLDGEICGIELYALDAEACEMEYLCFIPMQANLDFRHMAWSEEEEALYYVDSDAQLQNRLMRMTEFNPDAAQCISSGLSGHFLAMAPSPAVLVGNDWMLVCDTILAYAFDLKGESAASSDVSQLVLPSPFSFEEYLQAAVQDFKKAHPDVEVVYSGTDLSAGEITSAVTAQSDALDLYACYLSYPDYRAMKERGYLLPLPEDEVFTGFQSMLWENLRREVAPEGSLVAVPYWLSADALRLNLQLWQEMGLTTEDVPATWPEFWAMLPKLAALAEDAGCYLLDPGFSAASGRSMLFERMLNDYLAYASTQTDSSLQFDTPVFRDALSAFEGVDFSALGLPETPDRDADVSPEEILIAPGSYDPISLRGAETVLPLHLSLNEELEPCAKCTVAVLFLNPYSQHQSAAAELLRYVVQRMPDGTLAALDGERTQGIVNPDAAAALEETDAEIASIEKELETADGDEKEEYQTLLESAQENRNVILQYFYWDVSDEVIQTWHALLPRLFPETYLGMDKSSELWPEAERYLAGNTDKDTLIRNLDQKVSMMMGEQ